MFIHRMAKTLVRFVLSFFVTSCAVTSTATPLTTATSTSAVATATISVTATLAQITYEQAVHQFDYSGDVPFEVKDFSAPTKEAGVTVSDILYTAHNPEYGSGKGWTLAYLVRPDGEGPFAGILFMHLLGGGITREEFLEEAKVLAGQGVVSLLIEGYFPWAKVPHDGESDRVQVIEQVLELRRGIDFLLTQPGVDPERIAYVGHDYGGLYGGILSGIETRIKAYVFMATPGTFSNWSINYFLAKSIDEEEYRKQMAVVDPILYVPHAEPAALLFQFSTSDGFVPKDEAQTFFHVASEPKEIKWYKTGHRLDVNARTDRLEWLTNN